MNLKDFESIGNKVLGMLELMEHLKHIEKDSKEYIEQYIQRLFQYTKEVEEWRDEYKLTLEEKENSENSRIKSLANEIKSLRDAGFNNTFNKECMECNHYLLNEEFCELNKFKDISPWFCCNKWEK